MKEISGSLRPKQPCDAHGDSVYYRSMLVGGTSTTPTRDDRMPLKYAEEIATIPSCPPSKCEPRDQQAFRFVFSPVGEKSFLPPARINPVRQFSKDSARCSGYALSFFVTREEAIAAYSRLRSGFPNVASTIGDHLAEGQVQPADGIATAPTGRGHFDLFEEQGCNLAPRFKIIECLI